MWIKTQSGDLLNLDKIRSLGVRGNKVVAFVSVEENSIDVYNYDSLGGASAEAVLRAIDYAIEIGIRIFDVSVVHP